MTLLELHPDLSYCRVDGHLIFLDIQNDLYFRLARELDIALTTYLAGGDVSERNIHRLIERKILANGSVTGYARTPILKLPARSAMEDETCASPAGISELLDAFAIVCSTQLQLKRLGLRHVLRKLVALREKRTSRPSAYHPSESRVMKAAAAFRGARLYVPVDMCCLLDSISMIKFLAKRELHADLVFGVTGDPFSAHCWVQYGTTVLNDALGHTSAFTPIRVI